MRSDRELSSDERPPEELAALRSAVAQVLADQEERRRRVRRINRRLRRRNLQLKDSPTGWAVVDRYSTLSEIGAMGLTLDQAEAWARGGVPGRRRRA